MKKNPTREQLLKRIASLEFEEDQLRSELSYTDQLLRAVGFPQGLYSIKEIAQDMLDNNYSE